MRSFSANLKESVYLVEPFLADRSFLTVYYKLNPNFRYLKISPVSIGSTGFLVFEGLGIINFYNSIVSNLALLGPPCSIFCFLKIRKLSRDTFIMICFWNYCRCYLSLVSGSMMMLPGLSDNCKLGVIWTFFLMKRGELAGIINVKRSVY